MAKNRKLRDLCCLLYSCVCKCACVGQSESSVRRCLPTCSGNMFIYVYICIDVLTTCYQFCQKQQQSKTKAISFCQKVLLEPEPSQQAHQGRKLVFSLAQTVTLSHTPTPPPLARVQHYSFSQLARLLFCFKVYFCLFVCLNVCHICTGTL